MFGLPLGRKRKASARRQIDHLPCMYDAADTVKIAAKILWRKGGMQ
jgi:hypothetical protein